MDKRKPEFDEQPAKWVEYQFTTCKNLLPLPPQSPDGKLCWRSSGVVHPALPAPGAHRGLYPRWKYTDLPRIGDRNIITATEPGLRKK
jgi:hypothetical protein